MNISASDVENGKLTATVTIAAEDVDRAIKQAYKEAAKQYPVSYTHLTLPTILLV